MVRNKNGTLQTEPSIVLQRNVANYLFPLRISQFKQFIFICLKIKYKMEFLSCLEMGNNVRLNSDWNFIFQTPAIEIFFMTVRAHSAG